MTELSGIVLAAGAGRRYGQPKALVDDWLERAVDALADGGCTEVVVVLGAAADQATRPRRARVVVATDWAEGRSASLRAGLADAAPTATAAVVSLVDLPDVGAAVTRRLLATPCTRTTLRRATYDGRPGHPVVLGRAHWPALSRLTGDAGAAGYLDLHVVDHVECGDLATGRDHDQPPTKPPTQEHR